MTSVQERLQLKREPIDKWTIREQLCLASAVCRSGDQNWMSVSRALKPFGEPNRPSDWFHQKNCAAQYGMLLGNVETPKRKKRTSSVDSGIETPAENILKRLLIERQTELKKLLAEEKAEYQKLQEDMVVLHSGKVTEDQLDKWCKEIDEEENRKELETITHAQWLKEREQRKQEIERVWRPPKHTPPIGQKRKSSDAIDNLLEEQSPSEEMQALSQSRTSVNGHEQTKPALSPLLTSLLKSPSQVQSSSILQSAIQNRPHAPVASPMITSLLNSNNAVGLVNTNIVQEITNTIEEQANITNDILDDANMPNIKIDDLANSILVQDGPLPEIKKEEVDDIISEIIENAQDIVADPEQHLELDGNGDININLELDDLEEEELEEVVETKKEETPIKEEQPVEEQTPAPPVVDPFEFQEDPVIFEPAIKPSTVNGKHDNKSYVSQYQPTVPNQVLEPEAKIEEKQEEIQEAEPILEKKEIQIEQKEAIEEPEPPKADTPPPTIDIPGGSVEIVEVVVPEDGDTTDKETNAMKNDKTPEQEEIVHSTISNDSIDMMSEKEETEDEKPKIETEESCTSESKDTATFEESSEASDITPEPKKETKINLDMKGILETTTITPDFTEELYDEMNMEVKVDKSGKMKRDYSRTKKKEEHTGFDVLLAIEKAQLEDSEMTEETFSDHTTDTEKKDDVKPKIKSETERSNSPWTEEEDNTTRSKRRYSTPATPIDSVPNSPASSSIFYEDDKDYRNWKKSVMLVYNRLATHKYASLFLKPINDDHAPSYSNLVMRPMDLQTIKKNIDNGTIRTTLEFKRDMMLMFTNAMMYNKTGNDVYSMAATMQQEGINAIEILMQATMNQDNSPLRRETRTSESGGKRKRTITDEMISKAKKKKDD